MKIWQISTLICSRFRRTRTPTVFRFLIRKREAYELKAMETLPAFASGEGWLFVAPHRVAWLNLPNLITIGRILLVPVVVWAIASRQMQIAFLVFLIAGLSDAGDGFLAKRLGLVSELGAHLDPLADKVLIVSIYIALGITEAIPRWIVILV